MARVPTAFEAGFGQRLPSDDTTPYQQPRTTPEQFGAGQARSLMQTGKGLQILGTVADEISNTADKNAANRAINEARDQLTQDMPDGS